jgi:hypothetical protein
MSNNPYGALAEYSDPEDELEDTATIDKLVAELSPMHKWDQLYDSQGEPHFLPGETIFFEQEPTVNKTVSVDGTVFTIIEDVPTVGDPPTGPTNVNVKNCTIDGLSTIRTDPPSVPDFPLASPLLGNTFRAKRNLPLISGLPAATPRISNSSMSTGTSGLAPNLPSPSPRPSDMRQGANEEFQKKDPHVAAPTIAAPTLKSPPMIPPPTYHQAINRQPVDNIRRPPSSGPPPGSPPGPPPGPAPPIPVASVNPPLLRGIDWREHRLDPRNVDLTINPSTNTIHPWYFLRHEVGSSINHGTRFRCFRQPCDQFLNSFDGHINLGSSNASLKSFLLGFPRLPSTAEKADIFSFLSAAAYFSSGFGVYVPPPHTLEPGDNKGMWWPLVSPLYKFNLAYYDNALLQALTSKTTKFSDISTHVGIRDLDLLSSPRQESDNRRSVRATSTRPLPVQQITQEDELDFLDNEQYLLVCQLSNVPGRFCDLCRSSEHLLRQCPHLMELKNNPMACKRILSALRATLEPSITEPATSRPSSTPSRGFVPTRARMNTPFRPETPRTTNRSSDRVIRAVTDTNDADTDESASITDNESVIELTDDENTVDERDFPYAGE